MHFSAVYRTLSSLPEADASLISGISRVDRAFKKEAGKKIRGKAIPFITPNTDRAVLPSIPFFSSCRGTSTFSAVRSIEFRYLPTVIGKAMCLSRDNTEYCGLTPLSAAICRFLSLKYDIYTYINEHTSAMLSPNITHRQAEAMPAEALLPTSHIITPMRISCSNIWELEAGAVFFRAMKYPLKQEDIPINGRDMVRVLRASAARGSPTMVSAIKSAPKNITADVPKAMIRVTVIHLPRIVLIALPLP